MCLQLQQLGLQLHEAQWTARHPPGGFSVSFFRPALDNQQPTKKKKKHKVNKGNVSKSTTGQSTTSHLKPDDTGSPAKSINVKAQSPIVAHQPPQSEPKPNSLQQLSSTSMPSNDPPALHVSEAELTSPSDAELSSVPNLSDCEDVKYESCNCTPGVSYRTSEGKEQWIPVIKRKWRKHRVCKNTDSDSSGNEVDVSCSRPEATRCTWPKDLS